MYKDVSPNRWSTKAIETVTRAGLMTGYPNGTFKPGQAITREEVAAVFARYLFRDGVFTDILPAVMPAVVMVHRGDALGSGACVARRNGKSYILTNAHVVGDKTTFGLVKEEMPNFYGTLITKDQSLDLALIATDTLLPALEVNTNIVLGQPVAVIGAPFGYIESVTVGVISSLHRDKWFQMDAPVSPGSSGSPVVNEYGEIVGLTVAKVVDVAVEGMGFAIKPEVIKDFIRRV